MNNCEKKIISKLLDMASDQFCNNGCNDLPSNFFSGMSYGQIETFRIKVELWMQKDDPEYTLSSIEYIQDWILMDFMRDMVLNEPR